MPTRLKYDDVKKYIEDQGESLISKEYVNCYQDLSIICKNCNEIYTKKLIRYKGGSRHKCNEEGIGKNRAFTYDFVKKTIEDNGDVLLSKEYKNIRTKLLIKCSKCNEDYKQTFKMIRKGTYHGSCALAPNRYEGEKFQNYLKRRKEETIKTSLAYKERFCVECDSVFKSPSKTQIYCSDKCYRSTDKFKKQCIKAGSIGGKKAATSQKKKK